MSSISHNTTCHTNSMWHCFCWSWSAVKCWTSGYLIEFSLTCPPNITVFKKKKYILHEWRLIISISNPIYHFIGFVAIGPLNLSPLYCCLLSRDLWVRISHSKFVICKHVLYTSNELFFIFSNPKTHGIYVTGIFSYSCFIILLYLSLYRKQVFSSQSS